MNLVLRKHHVACCVCRVVAAVVDHSGTCVWCVCVCQPCAGLFCTTALHICTIRPIAPSKTAIRGLGRHVAGLDKHKHKHKSSRQSSSCSCGELLLLLLLSSRFLAAAAESDC